MRVKRTKETAIALLALLIISKGNAQSEKGFSLKGDSLGRTKTFINPSWNKTSDGKLSPRSLLIPGMFIAYGFASLGYEEMRDVDEKVREEVWMEHPHRLQHIDNFLQFAPAVSVYVLNMAGIKGKNNLRDRSMILLLSNMITNASVYSIKTLTQRLRPDGSTYSSFPSGHTAEAFASAEFLRQEYKDVSPWYGVAGYATAATVGYLRIYNNKHWVSDVVAGAGIGMLSTKLAYWIYPSIKRLLFKDRAPKVAVMPMYQNKSIGFSLVTHL